MIKRYVDSRYLTRAEHISYIKELAEYLGYTPTRNDIPIDRMLLIKKHYTTWLDVIRAAGLERASTKRQKKLRREALDRQLYALAKEYERYGEIVDRDTYEFLKDEYTYNKKRVPDGYEAIDARSSKEEIRSYLIALAEELGYTPTMRVTSGASQIIRKYDSWYEAVDDAGLERPNSIRQTRLRKEVAQREFDRLLRSICQEDINKKMCKEYV